jgi:hypothetical protein
MKNNTQGQFEVIDSFVIRRREEFYLIGRLVKGTIQADWFLTIPFNSSFGMTIRISNIEEVEITGEKSNYLLLIFNGDGETLDLLLGLNIGSELLDITIEGAD